MVAYMFYWLCRSYGVNLQTLLMTVLPASLLGMYTNLCAHRIVSVVSTVSVGLVSFYPQVTSCIYIYFPHSNLDSLSIADTATLLFLLDAFGNYIPFYGKSDTIGVGLGSGRLGHAFVPFSFLLPSSPECASVGSIKVRGGVLGWLCMSIKPCIYNTNIVFITTKFCVYFTVFFIITLFFLHLRLHTKLLILTRCV